MNNIQETDQKEKQLQAMNICQRIYNFFKSLSRNAHKVVIPDPVMPCCLVQVQATNEASSKSGQLVLSTDQEAPSPSPSPPSPPPPQQHEGDEARTCSNDQQGEFKHALETNDPSVSNAASAHDSEETKRLEEDATLPSNASQAKPPKKMVSINENVETINTSKKKRKKKKEQEVLDDPKPLKSILKVPSDMNNYDAPERLLSRANGA